MQNLCYNKDTKNETTKEITNMKYRVYFKDNKYFPTYFYKKSEAIKFQKEHGGEIQRKVGCEWYGY